MYTEADSRGSDSDSHESLSRSIVSRSVADRESQQLYGSERSSRRSSGSTDNTVARTFDDEMVDQLSRVALQRGGTTFMPLANEIQGRTNLFISASHPPRERTDYFEGVRTNAAANATALSSLVGSPTHHLPASANRVPQQQVVWQQIVLQQQRHEQQLQHIQHLQLRTMRHNQRFSAGDLGASIQNQVQQQEDQKHLQQIQLQLQQHQQHHSLMPHLDRSIHASIKQRGASITPPDLQNAIPGVSLETVVPSSFATSTLPRLPAASVSLPTFQLSTAHRAQTFPMKLHQILCDPFFHDSIAWLPDGKSWRIRNQERFVDMLIQKQYFKHSNFQSFMRQVNGQSIVGDSRE
eukprot:scaffold912_cov119-Cylindrotheca_fusiformis.AAC.4